MYIHIYICICIYVMYLSYTQASLPSVPWGRPVGWMSNEGPWRPSKPPHMYVCMYVCLSVRLSVCLSRSLLGSGKGVGGLSFGLLGRRSAAISVGVFLICWDLTHYELVWLAQNVDLLTWNCSGDIFRMSVLWYILFLSGGSHIAHTASGKSPGRPKIMYVCMYACMYACM